jgi:ketosteroid isomerase-like protein
MIKLPMPIESYFAARSLQDAEKAAVCFAEDATVWDNGEDLEIKGVEKIRDWIADTSVKLKITTEIKSVDKQGDSFLVAAVLSGDFPGSPYKFEYLFTLEEGKIKSLAIDPIGPVPS